jgi:hypothetical protein
MKKPPKSTPNLGLKIQILADKDKHKQKDKAASSVVFVLAGKLLPHSTTLGF